MTRVRIIYPRLVLFSPFPQVKEIIHDVRYLLNGRGVENGSGVLLPFDRATADRNAHENFTNAN